MDNSTNSFEAFDQLSETPRICIYGHFLPLTDWSMNLFPNEQHFDLNKFRQNVRQSLKEHHKISNIPKFRCEML